MPRPCGQWHRWIAPDDPFYTPDRSSYTSAMAIVMSHQENFSPRPECVPDPSIAFGVSRPHKIHLMDIVSFSRIQQSVPFLGLHLRYRFLFWTTRPFLLIMRLIVDRLLGSPLFCMGNTMSPTSTEADHGMGVLNAKLPLLSKCPGFHHQDISLIEYLNPIPPT